MADTGGTLRKTTHKTIGHAPASLADYNTAFSPNTASGGWHRGDGCFSTHGSGWSLFGFNDFFVSNGTGGVQALFRRNAVLMVDTSTGVVSWLSSGDQFALPGSVTFPAPEGGSPWCWLKGGWATDSDSAMLMAGRWQTSGSLYSLMDIRVMRADSFTGSSPTCTAVTTTNLDVSVISWASPPFSDGSYVYLYGTHASTFAHYVCRHIWSATPTDYATGWEYWTGSAWSTSFASAAPITVGTPPLRALTVQSWNGGYLGTSKHFDTAPELGVDDIWPDILAWWAERPQGPWFPLGAVWTPTTQATWYSYLGRMDQLPGVPGYTAVWSLNKSGKTGSEFATYGPQLAAATAPVFFHGSSTVVIEGAGSGAGARPGVVQTSVSVVRAGSPSGAAASASSGSATTGHGT